MSTIFKGFCFLCLCLSTAQAAQTGVVSYPYLGIQFSIPDGWQGAEDGELFLMGSNTVPGLLVVMQNEAQSASDLKREADKGIVDVEQGVNLLREGGFDRVGTDGLGAVFSGVYEYQPAKAYIIGLINPFGKSITVAALTSSDSYSDEHRQLALAIANSVAFAVPEESALTQEWRQSLKGLRLAYRYSSYDSGAGYTDASGQVYGSYSSASETVNIDLCSNNQFSYSSSSTSSFDSSGGFGGAAASGANGGRWQVSTLGDGQSQLELNFGNGEISVYELLNTDNKLTLNGSRYYRIDSELCQ